MKVRNALFLKAAVAGLVGAAVASVSAGAAEKAAKKQKGLTMEVVKCYGVNSCSAKGKCAGPGHECAGNNTCKGQGWLYMPAESCTSIEGGSLTPVEAKKAEKKEEKK